MAISSPIRRRRARSLLAAAVLSAACTLPAGSSSAEPAPPGERAPPSAQQARPVPEAMAAARGTTPDAGGARPKGPPPRPTKPPSLPVFQEGALARGWTDLGWAPKTLAAGKPAKVDFSSFSGWILSHAELKSAGLGGLLIRLRAPASFGDFLEVGLDSRSRPAFPRVRVGPEVRNALPDGTTELWIPMEMLDPLDAPFDRLVLRAVRPLAPESVEVSLIGFTAEAPPTASERVAQQTPPRKATVVLDCGRTQRISPLVYGVSFGDVETTRELGATARRWGGNTTSRYNWKLGNAWNTGSDWFFRNVDITKSNQPWDRFLAEGRALGVQTAFTLPLVGWVAKDTTSCGYPVATFGEQKRVDPQRRDCGDGIAPSGATMPPGAPGLTSVPAGPDFVADWVKAIRAADLAPRSSGIYFLDNEPTLWHLTHRDVHPEPLSYDELIQRTVDYATAVREVDPQARIAGFVAWGWSALFYSAIDILQRPTFLPVDRLRHGSRQLLPWWLSQLREHDRKTGRRLVDLVDVHYYPQAQGVGMFAEGWTDRESCARRIRTVRGLWDPNYRDESWIREPMRLVPRVREWIDKEYPGLGVSIGEYNFGAEGHISGGLAVAEALGRFGTTGVEAAFYWALPPRGSPAYWGFRAFRNYDGKGGAVGDESVAATSDDKGLSSVFATRRADGRLVLVALNHEPEQPLELTIDPGSCGAARPARFFTYAGEQGLKATPLAADAQAARLLRLAPWSINVVELEGGSAAPTAPAAPAAGSRTRRRK